jgi:eukaryotic-like serine/threonine-protein kinase
MQSIIDGKYQIIREVGKGGMGAVYEARHLGTSRRVALKVILAADLNDVRSDLLARFQREARASGAIDSQHVVQVFDTGVDPATGNPYIVMEFLSGEDLRHLVGRIGVLAPDLALRILAQACVGLACAHEAGVVHRDVKSANVYLARRDGGELVVKVLDFGIAKVKADPLSLDAAGGLTSTGAMLGSPLYMSPEQTKGMKNLDARSDIWSLGVVLYELLSGTTPHAHCTTVGQLIVAICSEPVRPVQERAHWLAPEVSAIVQRALQVDPAHRFQSAVEMHAAIVALLPQGTSLHESMLAPAPEAMRRASPSTTTIAAPGRTTAGVMTGPPAKPRPPRSIAAWGFAVAVITAGAVGLGIASMSRTATVPDAARASVTAAAGGPSETHLVSTDPGRPSGLTAELPPPPTASSASTAPPSTASVTHVVDLPAPAPERAEPPRSRIHTDTGQKTSPSAATAATPVPFSPPPRSATTATGATRNCRLVSSFDAKGREHFTQICDGD